MTIVHGQIESLARLKEKLSQKGLNRFKSIGDIKEFQSNYDIEKQNVLNQIEQDINIEIDVLKAEKIELQKNYDDLKSQTTNRLNNRILKLITKCDIIRSRNTNYLIIKLFNWVHLIILKFILARLEKNFHKIINRETRSAEEQLSATNNKIFEYTENREKLISERSSPKLRELAFTRDVLEGLNPLIAGAIGEHMVEKELRKLSDKHFLFNDFSIDFETPIYNKKEKDKIFSIQIDHLLVTNSGIFILETKNWSKKSIASFDLRSPVKQIRRTSYALFVMLNSKPNKRAVNLNSHHWGDKQLPIRNIVVMINEKPKEQFKYVSIKTLSELNRYISYFDKVFDDSEVKSISEHMKMLT